MAITRVTVEHAGASTVEYDGDACFGVIGDAGGTQVFMDGFVGADILVAAITGAATALAAMHGSKGAAVAACATKEALMDADEIANTRDQMSANHEAAMILWGDE